MIDENSFFFSLDKHLGILFLANKKKNLNSN